MFDPKVGLPGLRREPRAEQDARAVQPARLGRRLHRDRRLELRVHAPQDGQGLANLYGGRAGWRKLDQFFATPEDAMHVGGYGGVIHEMLEARDVRMGRSG